MFIKRKILEVQPFNFPWWPNCKYLSACYGKFNTVTNLVSLLHNYHQQNPSFTFRFTEIFSFSFELNFITILNQVKWNIKNSLFIIRLWYNCWELCLFVSSDRSSCSDDGLLYIYPQQATFSDFHSVHWCNWCYKCHSKSLKQYQCNWCHKISWAYLGHI